MRGAAMNGHEKIVVLCKEWGATDLDGAKKFARMNGHENIVRLLSN